MNKMAINRIQRVKRKWIDGYLMRGWRIRPSKTIILETTNICSLKCSCCPNGVLSPQKLRPRGMMSRETFDMFLKHLDIPVNQCFLHMCGEPFMNKNLYYFAEQLLAHGIVPVVFSNGYNIDYVLLDQLLSLKGINIAFSMDLLSKELYEQIRIPGKFETGMNSLKKTNEIFSRRKRFYGLNIIISEAVITGIDSACQHLFEEYSNLNKISLSSMWPWPDIPQTGDIAGHISTNRSLCKRIKELPAVLWNGDVSFCSFDYSGNLIVGNIYHEYFRKIFNSRKTRRVRRILLTGNEDKESLCRNCLLPRYDSFSHILYRNRYSKMTQNEHKGFIQKIKNYYAK